MMMMGLHFMKEDGVPVEPFNTVYVRLCAIVCDKNGQKMSSEGRTPSIRRLIDEYGARRAAFHAGDHGGAGPRCEARSGPHRRLP